MEKGFMGDPRDFFFFRVTTGGGVTRVCFWGRQKERQVLAQHDLLTHGGSDKSQNVNINVH